MDSPSRQYVLLLWVVSVRNDAFTQDSNMTVVSRGVVKLVGAEGSPVENPPGVEVRGE